MIFVTNDDVMGKNIRFLRQQQNLTPKGFSEKMHMDPAVLEALEDGNSKDIDGQLLERICFFFHISVKTLVEKTLE